MNPANTESDSVSLQHAITSQGSLLGQHDQLLRGLMDSNRAMAQHVSDLASQVSTLVSSFSSPPSASNPVPGPTLRQDFPIADPEPFHGEVEKCRGFIFQCRKVFRQRPVSFASDATKINYMLSLLRGRALAWAEAHDTSVDYNTIRFEDFSDQLSAVFDYPNYVGTAANRLLSLQQGPRTVADYAIEFRTLAAEAQWNEKALTAVFIRGLRDPLKDELATRDESDNLQSLITLTSRLDNRMRERRAERAKQSPPLCSVRSKPSPVSALQFSRTPDLVTPPQGFSSSSGQESMQLGRAKLSPEERQRRMSAGECLYCGYSGHYLSNCPRRPKASARQ